MPSALITCFHLQNDFESLRPRYDKFGVVPILPQIDGQHLPAVAMSRLITGVDAVIAGDDEIDAAVLEAGKATGLKAVIKWGIGTDSIDKVKATELGIPIYNTPGTFANEVADLAFSLLLNAIRKTHLMHNSVMQGGWLKVRGRSLAGLVAGIIGLGAIGRSIARRALAFEMKPVGYDIRQIAPDVLNQHGLAQIDFQALLCTSDVIFLACELTPQNRHLLNAETFRQMKDGVYVVNVSRGSLIEEQALCAALESGKVAGAGLDVFEVEPLPKESALRKFGSCVFSTHNGSNTSEAVARVNQMTTDILFHVLGLQQIQFSPHRVA